MKKLAAILLLALFVFNTIAYRLLVDYVQKQSDIALESQLDKGDYNDNELITVKVPVNLPYQTNWKDYERTDGEININGETFKYVKRKLYNDTLILLCIPHHKKTEIQQKANDYFGNVNGLPANNENSEKAEVFKQLLSDFECTDDCNNLLQQPFSVTYNTFSFPTCLAQYIPPQDQPPEISHC